MEVTVQSTPNIESLDEQGKISGDRFKVLVSDLHFFIKERDKDVIYPLVTFRSLILSDLSARMFRFPSALRIDCQQDDSTDSDTI